MMISFPHPQTVFIRITPQQRQRIEAMIDDLVSLLDFVDGDVDLEDGADAEPSLGWTLRGGWSDDSTDRELQDEDLEDDDPAEESDNGIADPLGAHEQGLL